MEVKAERSARAISRGRSEGSAERPSRPDEQKPDRGSAGRTSGPMTAKSISIKHRRCRFGGCAAKVIELTSGDLSRVAKLEASRRATERIARFVDRATEVSRGHSSRRCDAFDDEGPNGRSGY